MMETLAFAKATHLLAATIWVGGMFFAYMALRPAAAELEPALRLPLWGRVFKNFFTWVWLAVILLPATGFWLVFNAYSDLTAIGLHVHIMTGLGILMILIYLGVYFIPYLLMRLALMNNEIAKAAKHLAIIRWAVLTNLLLGLTTMVVAHVGPILFASH